MTQRVFIIGMYKSGTSWLLSALAKVPGTVAVREIDILKAVSKPKGDGYVLRDAAERVEYVFGGTAWCGLPVDYLRPEVVARFLPEMGRSQVRLGKLPAPRAIMALRRMFTHRRNTGSVNEPLVLREDGKPRAVSVGKRRDGDDKDDAVSFQAVPVDGLCRMFDDIRGATGISQAAEAFVAGLERTFPDAERVVLKGADQLTRFDLLREWVPNARKILIVRDGRDVAISASHYRSLMSDRRMPWRERSSARIRWIERLGIEKLLRWGGGARMLQRLEMTAVLRRWAARINQADELARRGEILLVRYEDLSRDFSATFRTVLDWLGMSASDEELRRIADAVSFSSQTGRDKGETREGEVKRAGIALGWVEALDERDRKMVWRVAGKELAMMGYSREGGLRPLDLSPTFEGSIENGGKLQ